MTLPELLIVISLMGVLAAVISMAITVTFRSANSTEGRVNVARAEQNVDVWLPADLASTDVTNLLLPAVDLDPEAVPCTNCAGLDLSGSNALQLAWTSVEPGPLTVVTRVQYQYIQIAGEWLMQRIECVGDQPCRVASVLRDLAGPEAPATFANYAAISPQWIMEVDDPPVNPDLELSDSARRVVVTINGGGRADGSGGGSSTVSLTAGGRVTSEIEADEFTVPSFVRARSRCGGPITLMVDTSGSIDDETLSNVVAPGVISVIDSFRNTPVQVQVVEFGSVSRSMGPSGTWHQYTDMTDAVAVDALIADVNRLTERRAGRATNWEQAFFHALKTEDGRDASLSSTLPERIVFFTDGVPTVNRRMDPLTIGPFFSGTLADYNAGKYNAAKWTSEPSVTAYNAFNQESFDRADILVRQNSGLDYVFVGVGPGLSTSWNWIQAENRASYRNPDADPALALSTTGASIIAALLEVLGGPVEANLEGGEYTNSDTANYYLQSGAFSASNFANAMRSAALADCGGTLTLQTRTPGGAPVAEEFIYENSEYRTDDGTAVEAEARRVTTSDRFTTGTFDYEIGSDSEFFSTDVVPQELGTLDGFTYEGWSCRSGADARTPILIDIQDSTFAGITIDVAPNEAVSCIMTVRPK